ncbi:MULTISPECIES: hypothetical protein [unclassified Pseudomonas]|jgi:hypothetical protein|uniref:DUF7673 family protein n=1 Tax=unclassified Pseudomonas TaxID=196821 RepID=UPI000C2F8AE2|nr:MULTISPECIES: hypothetical protein [unclassified Pseudomonas]MCU1739301.1 hypothetical protein [Pseudomonas sp. 20S_6.2_Bac1]
MNPDKPHTPEHTIEIGDDVISSIRKLVIASTTGERDAEPVAAFLMAWYDPATYGGFNVNDLWEMDEPIREAAAILFTWLSKNRTTPKDLDLDLIFEAISVRWAI